MSAFAAPAELPAWLHEAGGARVAWVALALALVLAGAWLGGRLRRWLGRRMKQRRAARAGRAERDAAPLLAEHGFEVLGRQVRQSWGVFEDGREVQFSLVADYVVERGGRRWVAEVKTGERALDLRHGPTRRQLLEYRQAFAADGVLLVDAEGRSLRSVEFPDAARERRSRLLPFAAGALLGAALAAASWPARRAPSGEARAQRPQPADGRRP